MLQASTPKVVSALGFPVFMVYVIGTTYLAAAGICIYIYVYMVCVFIAQMKNVVEPNIN